MKKNKIQKLITISLLGALVICWVQKPVNVQAYDALNAPDNGGIILPIENLRSPDLVNPKRDYNYRYHGAPNGQKSVQSVENVEGLFDYVVMEPLDVELKKDLSHLKYIAIHETGTPAAGAGASNVFSAFTKQVPNAMFIVDETTVLQSMPINGIGYSIGNTDPAKSDLFNTNSLSIEMCDNVDGDYMKTVANTIYLVRGLLKEFPHLELKQHADAFSEGRNEYVADSFQKNCPARLREESTWWTWEKFVHFATNPELEIPYIDFNPEVEDEVPANIREFLDYKSDEKIDIVETEKQPKIIKERKFNNDSIFKDNSLLEDEILEFDRYVDIDVDKSIEDIKKVSDKLKLSDEELRELFTNLKMASKIEKVNPHIVIQLMNSYTGYFGFTGRVQKEDYNYGGLKNKDGEFIKYDSIQEGTIAYVQYLKTLTSRKKLKLDIDNNSALKTIKKKGSVKDFEDLAKALEVNESFVKSTVARIEENFKI